MVELSEFELDLLRIIASGPSSNFENMKWPLSEDEAKMTIRICKAFRKEWRHNAGLIIVALKEDGKPISSWSDIGHFEDFNEGSTSYPMLYQTVSRPMARIHFLESNDLARHEAGIDETDGIKKRLVLSFWRSPDWHPAYPKKYIHLRGQFPGSPRN